MADELIQFPPPDPRAADAYGVLLASELADPLRVKYLQPWVCAALRYAFYRVHAELGPAVQPPQVADCSQEDGSTPVGDDGILRHPAGAHDNGLNQDVTYYMVDQTTDTWSVGPDDGEHLVRPPSRMDFPRQARWYEVIGELDLEYSGSLIRLAAVDPLAEAPIDAAVRADLAESADDRNQAQAITFSSYGGGWQDSHHTHTHLRWIAQDDGDRIAGEIEAKIEALLSQGPGPASPATPDPSPETGGGDGNDAGTVPAAPAKTTPAPSVSRDPYLFVWLRPEWIAPDENDTKSLPEFGRRVQQIGFNGMTFWDWDPCRKEVPDYSRRMYDALCNWASDAKFSLMLQAFPTDAKLRDWWGLDGQILETKQDGDTSFICMADPRVHDCYAGMLDNILSVFPKGSPLVAVLAAYDEIRIGGTHSRCRTASTGELLAAHAKRTFALVRGGAPHLQPACWNDMFDPFHNAKDGYFSTYQGTAKAAGAPESDVLIVNWNTARSDTIQQSFQYWADRGNRQVFAGYYGGASDDGASANEERQTILDVQKNPGVCGYQYTCWSPEYGDLARYLVKSGWARPGGTGATPPPPPPPDTQPATPNTVLLAHGDPWPDLQPGMTVLLGDGDWRTLSFRGEKGTKENPITIRAQNPGKVRAAIEITEGNEWVTWDLR